MIYKKGVSKQVDLAPDLEGSAGEGSLGVASCECPTKVGGCIGGYKVIRASECTKDTLLCHDSYCEYDYEFNGKILSGRQSCVPDYPIPIS
jgi:hypothetical protein